MELVQVDANECKFSCPPDRSVVLQLGTTITLVFSSPGLEKSLELPAKVVSRSENAGGRLYGVRFTNTAQLPLPLYALMTRRSDYRVKPAPREKVSIRVRAAPAKVQRQYVPGQMEDISASGVGICLNHDCETELASCEQIHIEIALPAGRATLQLVGRIKNRRLKDDKLVYGVEFDRERSEGFAEHEKAIHEYVAARLQDEVRRSDQADARLGAFL
jgi:hypothetical protein